MNICALAPGSGTFAEVGGATVKRVMRGLVRVAVLSAVLSSTVAAKPARQSLVVDGLESPAEVRVDRWGVPHIYARTQHDAFLAQGWNAARDRLWQIDLWRRSGLGELSAALGDAYLAQDRAIRLFVYRGDMTKEWAAYGPDAKRNASAFVAGVNAYIAAIRRHAVPLPHEFELAGYEPADWSPEDVVRIRDHGLVVGVGLELLRAQAMCSAGPDAAELLLEVSPPWKPIVPDGLDLCSISPRALEAYLLAQKPVVFTPGVQTAALGSAAAAPDLLASTVAGRFQGSNNWVIGPEKSATGRPVLANDPHRNDEVPSLRYLAHLVAPGLDVIGAGEPALPGISIGHNERIAFGLTVFPIAQEDLYVYETNPANPNEYRYQGGWEPMRVVHEPVRVRGAPDADAELKFTRHGPVVFEDPEHQRAYAVRATWLDTGGAPYFASMRYIQAHNLGEFKDALRYWGEPGENQIYADTGGSIGWFPSGFTPARPTTDGLLPLPGDGRYEWNGYLDHGLLPSEVDPPRHYVATANQLNLPKDYPFADRRVGFVWYEPARFERITEALEAKPKLSLKESEALQNDYETLPGRELVKLLATTATDDPELRDTIAWLKAWDGRATAESPQAALFEVWQSHHLGDAVLAAAAGALPQKLRTHVPGTTPSILAILAHPDSRLGADPRAARDALLLQSLAAALAETKERLGSDRSAWAWGKLQFVLLEHPLAPLADEHTRAQMNVGPRPKAGDHSTVGASYYRPKDFRLASGASFRMVIDVGHWDRSVAVNTPGQSGDWTNEHYRDLFPLWLSGEYFPLLYSRAAVVKATTQTFVLEPRP